MPAAAQPPLSGVRWSGGKSNICLWNLRLRVGFAWRMPRYFFHLHNHIETPDEEGVALADLAAARDLAEREARSMAAQSVAHGKLDLHHSIEVTDAAGTTVLRVRFGDVIEIVR